jgi:hypothetical protein
MKEEFLKKEWAKLGNIQKNYDDYDEFKEFMNCSAQEYLELKKNISLFKGTLEEFSKTLEFGYNNYEKNQYLDFNYGNLTCTIYEREGKLYLSNFVEIWNDGICTCEYNSFDIEKCLN